MTGMPAPRVDVWAGSGDRTTLPPWRVVLPLTVTHGRSEPGQQPDAPTCTFDILGPDQLLAAGHWVQVIAAGLTTPSTPVEWVSSHAWTSASATWTGELFVRRPRFTGRVQNLEAVEWAGAVDRWRVVATGNMGELGTAPVDPSIPDSGSVADTARAMELMTNQMALISRVAVGTSRHTVLRAPVTGSCLEAVHALCEDTGAVLLQDVDGFMVYQAPDWETRPAQARLLPQDVISGVAWRAETNRIINSVWIKYGPEAGRLDYQVLDQPSAFRCSVRHVTLDTQLADEVSAITTANLIMARRKEPLWMLGQVEVDTRLLSQGDVTMVQALRAGDAIILPLLPEPSAAGEYSEWTVQGWAQVWEVADSSRITLSVLDRGAGAAGINRWSDLAVYTWGQLAALTWGEQLTGDLP